MTVDVTVVIPTRDRWPYAARAVSSAAAQAGVSAEVVVVDDGSARPVPSHLKTIAEVRWLRMDGNRGVAAARNAGARAGRGEFVAFLDDDDVWAPDKLRTQLRALTTSGAGFVYAAALRVDDALRPLSPWPAPPPGDLAALLFRANVIPAGASNVLMRSELFRVTGGFDERFFHLADWDLWLRLSDVARPAAVDEPLVAYVQHAANMISSRPWSIFGEYDMLKRKHHQLARRNGQAFRPDGLISWVASRHGLAGNRRTASAWWLAGSLRYRRWGRISRRALRSRSGARAASGGAGVPDAPPWLTAAAARPTT